MRIAVLGFILLFALGDGCSSGVVGVQEYGTVTGRVLDATTNTPIPNAIVSVGSLLTATADAAGAFTIEHVPVGDQDVTARAPGFTDATAEIEVRKDRTISAGYLRLVSVTKPDDQPTLPPPPNPTPTPQAVPAWTPPPPSPSPGAATPSPLASPSPNAT